MNKKKIKIIPLGKKIRNLRESKGLTQVDLANELGLHKSAIHKYEKGVNKISIKHFIQISELLGISDYKEFLADTDANI